MSDEADQRKVLMVRRIEQAREAWRALDDGEALRRSLRQYRRVIQTPALPRGIEQKRLDTEPMVLPDREPHSLRTIRSLWSPKGNYPHFTIEDDAVLSQQLSVVHEAKEMRQRLGFENARHPRVNAVWNTRQPKFGREISAQHSSSPESSLLPQPLHPDSLHPDSLHPDSLHPDSLHPDSLHTDSLHTDSFDPDLSPIAANGTFLRADDRDEMEGNFTADDTAGKGGAGFVEVGNEPTPRVLGAVMNVDLTTSSQRTSFREENVSANFGLNKREPLAIAGDLSTKAFLFLEEYVALRAKHMK